MDLPAVRWWLEVPGLTGVFCVFPIVFCYGYLAMASWYTLALVHLLIALVTDFNPMGNSKLVTERGHSVFDFFLGVFCVASPYILTGSDGYGSNSLSSTALGFAIIIVLPIINVIHKALLDGTGKEEYHQLAS
mmetsp:Transcript_87291/g.282089  ORF Transcript_87291/g.282089 Transcript_87291/m.282089 type:complete len:133 (-) Transcript_87291:84-482(-)